MAWTGEVRNLVLIETGAIEHFNCDGIHLRDGVVGGNQLGVIACAVRKQFATETLILIDLEHVDAGVRNARAGEGCQRLLPRSEGLACETGDQVDAEICDASGA